MVVAGEASGDLHGAALCRALRQLAPHTRLVGMGGPRMAAAGVEVLADVTRAAAVGTSEVLGRLPAIWRAWRRVGSALRRECPAAVVLIDFPEFNLRLARLARAADLPVVYYIPPQVWAWRAWRVRAIKKRVSLVLAAFPFEQSLYRRAGVAVEFVGHPVLDALETAPTRLAARRELGLDDATVLVGLLPGSRHHEVERMTPLLHDAAARLARQRPGARFALALAPTVEPEIVRRHLGHDPAVRVVDRPYAVMRAADLLLVTSGTATLEAALLGTPMVVCYRPSGLTRFTGRALVRVPWISLVNIALGRAVVPELWHRVTADQVADHALGLLDTPDGLKAQQEAFAELRAELGASGVGERAARLVLAAAGA